MNIKLLHVIILVSFFSVSSVSAFSFSSLKEQAMGAYRSIISHIDSLEYEGAYPLYKLDYLRACAYLSQSMFTKSLEHIKSALNSDEISSDTVIHKQAYMLLSELAVFSCSLLDASKYIAQGKQYADNINDDFLEASILLSEGVIYRRIGFLNKARNSLFSGIRILEKKEDLNSTFNLSHAYGLLMLSYMHENDFKAAWQIGRKRKLVLNSLEKKDKRGYLYDNQAGYYYSKMAYLNYLMGYKEEARECYHMFCQTMFSSTFRGGQEINDYLLAVGEYTDVIENVERYYNEMDVSDTLNVFYFRSLQQAGAAYEALGEYRKAFLSIKKWAVLQENMRTDYERNFLFETADLFNALNSQDKLNKKDTRIKIGNYVVAVLAVLSLLLFIRLVRNWFVIRKNNKKIKNLIIENEDQRTQLDKSISDTIHHENEELHLGANNSLNNETDAVISDKYIYSSFHSYVKSNRLFLDNQLGRDDYARIMKTDKNRFATILKEQSGMNLANYLNSLRLEYSVNLFRKHPEYSVNEVAQKSGIPNASTFYRLFKDKYGMNPSTFRQQVGSSYKS